MGDKFFFEKLIFVFSFLVIFSAGAAAQDFANVWDINRLSKTNDSSVTLKNKKNTVLKTVSTSQLRLIVEVFSNISEASELSAELILVEGNQPNAFAGPIKGSNTVGVNFAMLDMLKFDSHEWAAVLGHEMAHLKLDHYSNNLIRKVPLAILSTVLKIKTDHQKTIRDSEIIMNLFDTKFSRDQERESDYLGAIWSVESDYNAWGAVRVHEKLKDRTSNFTLPFLRSHPTSRERVKTLTQLAERLNGQRMD